MYIANYYKHKQAIYDKTIYLSNSALLGTVYARKNNRPINAKRIRWQDNQKR